MAENKAKPEFPPILTIKRQNFEKAFKYIMSEIISTNKMTTSDLNEINRQLTRWLITGMNTVDFEKDFGNKKALEDLVEDLWTEFYRDLNLKVRKHRTKFRRK
jgi:hypothetical protein